MSAVFDDGASFDSTGEAFVDTPEDAAPTPLGTLGLDGNRFTPLVATTLQVPRPALVCKRIIDILGSLLLLALLSPLFIATAIAVAMSGRQVLFSQPRVGQYGRSFRCYKFRSMVIDAERRLETLLETDPPLRTEWQQTQKLKRDPRITRVGAFIRRASIDELPQLWNVLRGDMSLVGPRPMLLNQYLLYGRAAKWYASMRPGITGLWQVTSRGDGDFRRRVALDCHYVRSYRLYHDFAILLKTVHTVLSGRGAV